MSWLNDLLTTWFAWFGDFDRICALVGLIFLLDLAAYWPFFEAFFGKVRGLKAGWLLAGLALMTGHRIAMLTGTVFFYLVYRHYYINSRWSSIRRGGGAPGFMSHWTAFYLLLLQLSAFLDGTGWLSRSVATMCRIDLAIIMICAGVYKYMIGYLKNDGMEYGRVNPMWGYFWRSSRGSDPAGFHETAANILGSLVEIGAGLCMLSSRWQVLGAFFISLSFVLIGLLIRLGRLAWLMTLLPALCLPGTLPSLVERTPFNLHLPWIVTAALVALTGAFLAVLPLVKFTQYYNLFANRNLPQPLQRWLTRFANAVPIIIWRVFTPDVTNFYLRIIAIEGSTERAVLTEKDYGLGAVGNWRLRLRFWHVTESIALTSVFTTLKYFPSNRELFDQKLLTYADSLGLTAEKFRFEYVSIQKRSVAEIVAMPRERVYDPIDFPPGPGKRFAFVHVGNFFVNRRTRKVFEQKLVEGFDFSAPSRFSPVRESAAPGSYELKERQP